ncbi:triphosphoribosyl-dephospho-CoA synthase CitG [Streptococcus dentasini]
MTDTDLAVYAYAARQALLYELNLSPKPGLVDRFDNGAHKDMTYASFIASIKALSPFFERYIQTGWHYASDKPQFIFERLRSIGIEAEKAMFQATNGVNTHKGVNFSLALLLGATGIYLAKNDFKTKCVTFTPQTSQDLAQLVQTISAQAIQADWEQLDTKTKLSYGERLFLDYGIKGPRGEAAAGFPTLIDRALPFFRQELKAKQDPEWSQLRLLLYLMSQLEDGNIIHRGGLEAWQLVKKEARLLLLSEDLKTSKKLLRQELSAYNQTLIERNLSPGGSADLLALTLYFAFLERLL